MTLWMRSLLIWLLVLAVPAQAIAAASMAFCGPDHHPAAAARQQAQVARSEHAHLAGAAKGFHAHHLKAEKASDANDATADVSAEASADEGAADLPAPAKAVQAEQQNDNQNDKQNDKQKCSVCASCCSGGAILSTVAHLVAPEFAAAEFVSVVPAVPAVAAGSPDRPPRSANA